MLNKEEIKKIIPQREPFLMIDEVEEYIPVKVVQHIKMYQQTNTILKDTFLEIQLCQEY